MSASPRAVSAISGRRRCTPQRGVTSQSTRTKGKKNSKKDDGPNGFLALRVFDDRTTAVYAPPGYLLYVVDDRLTARPFDSRALRFTGDAFTVVDRVNSTPTGRIAVDVATNGTLVYRRIAETGRAGGQAFLIKDAADRVLASVCGGTNVVHDTWRVSPPGGSLALIVGGGSALWLCDLRSQQTTRLSSDCFFQGTAWSPDGSRVAYGSVRGAGNHTSGVFVRAANAATDEVQVVPVSPDSLLTPLDWSADGHSIIYSRHVDSAQPPNHDLWVVTVDDRSTRPYLATRFDEVQAALSPDGKYVAYTSNELGDGYDVVVQPFPTATAGKWKVSGHGGCCPRWNANGSELFYVDNSRHIVKVPVRTSPAFSIGAAEVLGITIAISRTSSGLQNLWQYDVMPDGRRFIVDGVPAVATGDELSPQRSITVLMNWTAAVKR